MGEDIAVEVVVEVWVGSSEAGGGGGGIDDKASSADASVGTSVFAGGEGIG